MRILLALSAILVAAACERTDRADRPADTIPPAPPAGGSFSPPESAAIGNRTCEVNGVPILTGDGIGAIRPGRTVDELKQLCEVVSDAQQRGVEGAMERVMVIRVAGEDVPATVVDDKVWRIAISSPRFRTSDSLGVDTPLRRIAAKQGAQFAPGEDGVYGFVPDHCGLSFRFSLPLRPPAGGQWTAASIGTAHADAAVNRVLVTRCAR